MEGPELIIFIISRGVGEKLIGLCSSRNISFSILLHGRGTVNSEILSMLGLDGPEKDIVLFSIEKARAASVMEEFSKELKLDQPGGGIAFMIPFTSLASQYMSYELFSGSLQREGKASPISKIVEKLSGRRDEKEA